MLAIRCTIRPFLQNPQIISSVYGLKKLSNDSKTTKNSNSSENWIPIYKFPYIKSAHSLCKLKNYQYVFTAVGLPVNFGFQHFGLIDPPVTELFAAFGITGCLTLTLAAFLCKHLVGMLYINSEKDKLRIGYITFLGRREDRVVSVEDVKPFSETQRFKLNLVNTVATYSDSRTYKLIDMAGVLRRDDYELVFGRN